MAIGLNQWKKRRINGTENRFCASYRRLNVGNKKEVPFRIFLFFCTNPLRYFYWKGRITMKTKGFTLVELLVVIAVIAILMAILMPALKLAKDQAYSVRCVSNLRNLSIAWFTYANENDSVLVDGHIPRNNNQPNAYWVEAPQDPAGNYTGDSNPTLEDRLRGIERGELFPYSKNVDVFRCSNDQRLRDPDQFAFRSYSIAGGMNGEDKYGFSGRAIEVYDEIKNPSMKIVFVEESDDRGWNMGSWVVRPTGDRWIDPLAPWHNKRSTLGFADGHSEKHRWLDERTIEMNEKQLFGQTHPGNPDLKFMQRAYQLRPE
jgi:prepilin-type N-terminal cleavage/methylation domain-containing protein/prepilin-type processing-associated H-X9-DG protein